MPLTASCSLKKGNNEQTSLELWLKVWTEAQEFSMTRKESHPLLKQGWNHQNPCLVCSVDGGILRLAPPALQGSFINFKKLTQRGWELSIKMGLCQRGTMIQTPKPGVPIVAQR